MKITEKILSIIAVLGIIMKLLHWPGANIMLILSLLILSMQYLYFGFAFFNNIRLRKIFRKGSYKKSSTTRILGGVFTGIALGMGIIAIMFYIMFWPGAVVMMMPALLAMLVVFLISLIKYMSSKDGYFGKILLRLGVFMTISLVLFLMPLKTRLEVVYPNDPSYVEAFLEYSESPNDPLKQAEIQAERELLKEKYSN